MTRHYSADDCERDEAKVQSKEPHIPPKPHSITIRGVSERDVLRLYALLDMAWPHDKYHALYLEEIKQSLFECGLNTIWEGYRDNPKHRAQIEAFEAKKDGESE